jgi:hypothetical protein
MEPGLVRRLLGFFGRKGGAPADRRPIDRLPLAHILPDKIRLTTPERGSGRVNAAMEANMKTFRFRNILLPGVLCLATAFGPGLAAVESIRIGAVLPVTG